MADPVANGSTADKLRDGICEAFCSEVEIAEFSGGLAIGTPYFNRSGDKIGIYALEAKGQRYKLIDNALTVSFLESDGVTLDNVTRRRVLTDLLGEYGAEFDDEMGEIYIDAVKEADLPKRVLDFSALLLRINDMAWLAQDRVKST